MLIFQTTKGLFPEARASSVTWSSGSCTSDSIPSHQDRFNQNKRRAYLGSEPCSEISGLDLSFNALTHSLSLTLCRVGLCCIECLRGLDVFRMWLPSKYCHGAAEGRQHTVVFTWRPLVRDVAEKRVPGTS